MGNTLVSAAHVVARQCVVPKSGAGNPILRNHAEKRWTLARRGGPLVVIFVGLEGGGKSTVCDQLETKLREEGVPFLSKADRDAYLREQWRLRRLSRYFSLLRTGWPVWLVLATGLWQVLCAWPPDWSAVTRIERVAFKRAWLMRAERQGVPIVLLDAFIEHNLVYLVRSCRRLADCRADERILRAVYRDVDAVFIVVEVSYAVALQRVLREPHKRAWTRGAALSSIAEELTTRVPGHERMRRLLNEQMGDRLRVLSGEAPVGEKVEDVKNLVMALFHERADLVRVARSA